MSLRKIVLNAAAMSTVNMMRLLAQFFALPVLSRLLSPEDYGLVGIAMPFVLFAMMLADAGIGMSLVRTPLSERRVWSTCFWLSLLFGLVLAAIMVGFAPIAAMIFKEAHLAPIIMALSLVIFAQAASSIPGAALQQSQRFRTIALVEVIAVALGIGAAILIATHGGGAWALVAQQLTFFIIRVFATYFLSPFRPSLVFDMHDVKQHLHFGRDVLGVNIVGFLSRSTDNLIIGKIIDTAAVGVYAMTFQFARLPVMLVAGPLQYVLYAQLAPIKDDRAAIARTFLILTRLLAIIIFPAMGMIAVAHAPVFTFLLSAKWALSGHLFMLAAVGSAIQAVTGLGGTIRMVMGRTDMQLRTTFEFGLVWMSALLIGVWFGLASVATMFSVAVVVYLPRSLMLLLPLIDCRIRDYLQTFVLPCIVTASCIATYLVFDEAYALAAWQQLLLTALLSLAGIALSGLIQHRYIREEIRLWRNAHAAKLSGVPPVVAQVME